MTTENDQNNLLKDSTSLDSRLSNIRGTMQTENEQRYLLKALSSFNSRLVVITPDFKIQAAAGVDPVVNDKLLRGEFCHNFFGDKDEPCINCPAVKVMETGKPSMRNHSSKDVLPNQKSCLYSYPIITDGEIEAYVIFSFDFPTLEGLEEELIRSNAFFHNLLQSACDGVIAADMTGKVIVFNDEAAKVSGYSIKEALSDLNIRDIYEGDGAVQVMEKLRSEEYGGKGKLKKYKATIKGKKGDPIPISLYAATIVDEHGNEQGSIGFFHDLREQIYIEKTLEKTQLQLIQSEKMASLGKLAAGVAHQINNPLGGITLYTKLMLEEYDLEKDAEDDLYRILKDAQRCRDTVKELLEFSRQTRQFMKPQNINRTIERTLFLIENQTLFHNITFQKKMAPFLPLVMADTQQLNHVFMNLIINAAQAMDGKGIISIKTCEVATKDRINIEISDTGPGISKEDLKHIFEPFFTTKEEGKGTGLGLSVVYGIIRNHKGTITAKSAPGRGSTFIIELPSIHENGKGVENGKHV